MILINKFFRFLYLNIYSFLLLFLGILIIGFPSYKISKFLYFISIPLGIFVLVQSKNIFSTWPSKKREYVVLMKKNSKEFNPESFRIFMQAPCGRLLTRVVLKDLNKSNEYKNLLKLKKPLVERMREYCQPVKTKVTFYK